MTLIDDGPRLADTFGVPVYYVTDVVREDAGDGNIRMWNCTKRNGVLIPSCEIIVPAHRAVLISTANSAFAQDLCQRQTFLNVGARH
jgi:hypothetical protein